MTDKSSHSHTSKKSAKTIKQKRADKKAAGSTGVPGQDQVARAVKH